MEGPIGMLSRFFSAFAGGVRSRLIIGDRSVCSIGDRVVWADLPGGEAVIFDSEDRRAILVNHTGALILGLTDGIRSVGEAAREIAASFGRERRVVARDVRRIYRRLLLEGVITMARDRSYVPVLKKETVFRAEDDGAFMFDPLTDELAAINETGRIVVEQINGKRSVADIVRKVRAVFPDRDEQEISRDVESFIDELKKRGFIAA
jgi:hypothetical protein